MPLGKAFDIAIVVVESMVELLIASALLQTRLESESIGIKIVNLPYSLRLYCRNTGARLSMCA